ncbi:uncharacterized protein LOC129003534 [Macrosteles quadrilineatus]|uniref:uncharacterized protein LOC129003534 n=1 Tax=Macrosteles quadrilineatus TaxID=74068 RepID=UPI0023E1FF93|nr:uncharacterized protein LOC129003534 [Macrosteles quadrilineatus]
MNFRPTFSNATNLLETRYAVEVEDIITNPPATNRYAVLRSKLIERLSNSEEECVRQLISDEDIGDRKPSQFLRHLRSLLGPAQLQDNILRALWLRRLPVNIQAILTAQNELPLDKLADIADKIIEVSPQVSVNATATREHTKSNDDLSAAIARLAQRIGALEVSLRIRIHQNTQIKISTNLQAVSAGIMPNLVSTRQNVHFSLFLRGKLQGRPVTAATDCQAPSRRIFVSDQKSNLRFLIDTGSDVSCYPKRLLRDRRTSTDFELSAANGSTIKTYGTCSMTLDLGLRRSFVWQFTVADVSVPIIGSDFLSYYHLLPDCRLLRLHDATTGLVTGGQLSVTTQSSVKSVEISQNGKQVRVSLVRQGEACIYVTRKV